MVLFIANMAPLAFASVWLTKAWLDVLAWNTPPLDWVAFISVLRRPRTEEEIREQFVETDAAELYSRELEIFGFLENVVVYLALGLIFGVVFSVLLIVDFLILMAEIWGIAYAAGIILDAVLINEGWYFPIYRKFRKRGLIATFKLFVFTIYRSALYLVIGLSVGRYLLAGVT